MKIKNKRTDASDPPRHKQTCPFRYNYVTTIIQISQENFLIFESSSQIIH